MKDVFLTEHFRLEEFVKDGTIPPEEVASNIRRLCMGLLEPIRLGFDHPLVVSSGYRPESANSAAGGVATSDHVTGNAADLQVFLNGKPDPKKTIALFHWIKDHCFGRFGQLILEDHTIKDVRKVWVHVSNITSKHPGAVTADILFSPDKGVYRRYVNGMEHQFNLA